MGVRTRKKRRNKSRLRINAKRKKKADKRISNPLIKHNAVEKAWESRKPASTNLGDMGLVFNLKRIPIAPKQAHESSTSSRTRRKRKRKEEETEVVKKIKEDVATRTERNKKEGGMRLTHAQVELCSYMIDRYGDDYKAMTRDRRNYFQETWRQFRNKIQLFLNNPHYHAEYLKSRKIIKKGKLNMKKMKKVKKTQQNNGVSSSSDNQTATSSV